MCGLSTSNVWATNECREASTARIVNPIATHIAVKPNVVSARFDFPVTLVCRMARNNGTNVGHIIAAIISVQPKVNTARVNSAFDEVVA